MNVYDFDNTILRGDSTALFFLWSLRRCPRLWADLPGQAVNGGLFLLRLRPKRAFKQRMLSFVRFYPDLAGEVERFWDANEHRVKGWYRQAHQADDVVISASPEFLIRPICARLEIRGVLASPVDPESGAFQGENCHGAEKVRRFRAAYPEAKMERFYSDSLSDAPLAALAEKAYWVRGSRLLDWPT